MDDRPIEGRFRVTGGPYAPGEPHRDPRLRRWRYIGRLGQHGRALWWRAPRLTRWQFAAVAVAAFLTFEAALFGFSWLIQHH